jgi:hypothetical protein
VIVSAPEDKPVASLTAFNLSSRIDNPCVLSEYIEKTTRLKEGKVVARRTLGWVRLRRG